MKRILKEQQDHNWMWFKSKYLIQVLVTEMLAEPIFDYNDLIIFGNSSSKVDQPNNLVAQ